MPAYDIYTGGHLPLSNQRIAVAVYIPSTAKEESLAPTKVQALLHRANQSNEKPRYITEDGYIGTLPSRKVGRQSLQNYLKAAGFALASGSEPLVQQLADHVDTARAADLFGRASKQWAEALARDYAGRTLELVPFDPAKAATAVTLVTDRPASLTVAHLDKGLALAGVRVLPTPSHGDAIDVASGWLRPEGTAEPAPRSTEYGGTIELACWLLCSVGFLELPKSPHLEMSEEELEYPRGVLRMRVLDDMLATDDVLVVGVSATDSVVVSYLRNGQELYRRDTFVKERLGDTLAYIAAALVHVNTQSVLVPKKLVSEYAEAWAAAFNKANPFHSVRPLNVEEARCVATGLAAVLPAIMAAPGQPVSEKVLEVFGRAWTAAFKAISPDSLFGRDLEAEKCVQVALNAVACSPHLPKA